MIKHSHHELKKIAENLGLDFQVVKVKSGLIELIREKCQKRKITQRQLARLVPGLSQDRVSKIFNGHLNHMTIDKLVEINSALKIKVSIKAAEE
jgi:predicted XRE-type DNA-binding protein